FRYDPADGSFRRVVSIPGATNFSLQQVAVAPGGDVYVPYGGGIQRYAGETGQSLGVVVPSAVTGAVGDLDFGPDGNLYVATSHGIDRFDPQTGALIDHFIPDGAGGLTAGFDFAFGGDGSVYVNSRSAQNVLRYDAATGAFRDVFVAPDQYALAGQGGVFGIVYAVPEPDVSIVALFAPAL